MPTPDLLPPHLLPEQRWTSVDAYWQSLARRRTARRARTPRQPGSVTDPDLLLSTLPFAVLIGVMGLMIVAFAIAAWPAAKPAPRPREAPAELGTAPPGWMEEAKREIG